MSVLTEEIIELLNKARSYHETGHYDGAIYFYGEAAGAILHEIKAGNLDACMRKDAAECISHAEELKNLQTKQNLESGQKQEPQLQLSRAHFLFTQALDEDEAGNDDEAIALYTEAIDLCLTARRTTDNPTLADKLHYIASQALERAEHLKSKQTVVSNERLEVSNLDETTPLSHQFGKLNLAGSAGNVSPNPSHKIVNAAYSKNELDVLRATSIINGREYVPFMVVDLRERFAFTIPFSDKDGLLALSAKQRQRFQRWVRPQDFLAQPTVIHRVDFTAIKQTVVSDCSFIASLAIAAQYEHRYNRKLVTSLIYPQDKRGEPTFNPCGKYMVKFHVNGVWRKVIVDDFLPMGAHGELLCSFSNNRNELWVSLLEKAYLKIMGGYDFPGSNSNIDLHALTGWIPERIAIRPNEPTFNADKTFTKLFDRFHKGDCLATLATGQLSDQEQERTGLVDCHAYAVLDLRQIGVKRFFLMKNPWNHLRWKGNYSERDPVNWTPEMQRALQYDPKSAQQFDDGVFWIDYESVLRFFDVIYVNWNLALFPYSSCYHADWNAAVGPAKDLYNIGDNPQYSLEVNSRGPSAAVWILLTRHITEKEDFANNREYITILVYKNGGRKVFYPFDPPPFIDGTRINSPHYLCKLIVKDPGRSRYTLVVSQYEKMRTIRFTLRVYASCEFMLRKIEDQLPYRKQEQGEWKGVTAGGCANYRDTHGNNPVYQISLETSSDENELCADLKGPKQYSVGFELVQVQSRNNKAFNRADTGSFRSGFCAISLDSVPAGVYNLVPSTFLRGQEGPFILAVQASCPFKLVRLR